MPLIVWRPEQLPSCPLLHLLERLYLYPTTFPHDPRKHLGVYHIAEQACIFLVDISRSPVLAVTQSLTTLATSRSNLDF